MQWAWEVPSDLEINSRADTIITHAINNGLGDWNFSETEQASKKNTYCTRSQVQRLIKENKITVNCIPIRANSILRKNDKIVMHFSTPEPINVKPENIPLQILFEDAHILVINKPQGISVHPSETEKNSTLVNALLYHVRDLNGIGGKLRPGIVHRLDKNTSGALVIAKTETAHTYLSKIFAKHDIERRYIALCYGTIQSQTDRTPNKKNIKIESLISRNPKDRKKMSMQVKKGRIAITHATAIEEFYNKKPMSSLKKPANLEKRFDNPFASLNEIKLETGRTHQIRVHLTGSGCSIIGDNLYGVPNENHPKWLSLPTEIQELIKHLPGQALHAQILGFCHPITHSSLLFKAEPPKAFTTLLEALRKYAK